MAQWQGMWGHIPLVGGSSPPSAACFDRVKLRSRYLCCCKFSITLPTSQRQIAVCKILLNNCWKQCRKVSVELDCYGETVRDSTTILRQFSGSNGLSLDILMLLFYIIPWKMMFFWLTRRRFKSSLCWLFCKRWLLSCPNHWIHVTYAKCAQWDKTKCYKMSNNPLIKFQSWNLAEWRNGSAFLGFNSILCWLFGEQFLSQISVYFIQLDKHATVLHRK